MIDIAIYAVIALVIIARLWAVLGQRDDDETQRPNPFVQPPPSQNKPPFGDDENVMVLSDKRKDDAVPGLLPPEAYAVVTPPGSLAGAMERVKKADPAFDEKNFLQGAKAAFTMVVEDYAKGEMARLERLLAPEVLYSFRQAVEARRESGDVLETKVRDIMGAEISNARVEDTRLFLTVDFATRQTNVMRNREGVVVSGHPDKAEEVRDVWVFARDTRSADPNWQIVETKS